MVVAAVVVTLPVLVVAAVVALSAIVVTAAVVVADEVETTSMFIVWPVVVACSSVDKAVPSETEEAAEDAAEDVMTALDREAVETTLPDAEIEEVASDELDDAEVEGIVGVTTVVV